jgi:hypothetical protein
MSTTELIGREKSTKYAFWLGPGGPTEKEILVLNSVVSFILEVQCIYLYVNQACSKVFKFQD